MIWRPTEQEKEAMSVKEWTEREVNALRGEQWRERNEREIQEAYARHLANLARAEERAQRMRAAEARDSEQRAQERQRVAVQVSQQRRSRIKWRDLIDNEQVCVRQEYWERRRTALAMREAGMIYAQIGDRLDVTACRASQMVTRAERERGKPSPLANHMNYEHLALLTTRSKPTLRRLVRTLNEFGYRDNRDWLLVGTNHA